MGVGSAVLNYMTDVFHPMLTAPVPDLGTEIFAVKSRNDKQFKPNKKYIDNLNNAYASNVTSTPTVDSPKMKFCPECGSKMEASAMFCGSCGFKINK